GTVRVVFVVDREGHVVNPQVESSTDPAFEKPALDAVKQWRFEAGTRRGRAPPGETCPALPYRAPRRSAKEGLPRPRARARPRPRRAGAGPGGGAGPGPARGPRGPP